ncbi:hypothetical protein ACRRTK_013867 [Alexandromys fortis]
MLQKGEPIEREQVPLLFKQLLCMKWCGGPDCCSFFFFFLRWTVLVSGVGLETAYKERHQVMGLT